MFSYAADRENLKKRWEKALKSGVTLVEEIKYHLKKKKNTKPLNHYIFIKQ